jgi:hypothetical protein
MTVPEGIQKLHRTLEAQWERCRWGLNHCDANLADRDRILTWMNQWPDSPWNQMWSKIILCVDIEGRDFVLQNEEFPHGNSYWRQMASSSPFAILWRWVKQPQEIDHDPRRHEARSSSSS